MVVDKDVEGLGEWTLGEVKTERVCTLTVLLFRWKTQSRGYICKIGQLSLHREDHSWCRINVVCWSIWIPGWPPLILMTPLYSDLAVSSLSLQAPSSSEDEGLPQCVWHSEFGITTPLGSIRAHSLKDYVMWEKGLSPDPPPPFDSEKSEESHLSDPHDPVSYADNSR